MEGMGGRGGKGEMRRGVRREGGGMRGDER